MLKRLCLLNVTLRQLIIDNAYPISCDLQKGLIQVVFRYNFLNQSHSFVFPPFGLSIIVVFGILSQYTIATSHLTD